MWDAIKSSYANYAHYLWSEITGKSEHHYLYWLMLLSLAVWLLEVLIPWRKKQAKIREDFWLDAFYMVFNFFLFSFIIYQALSDVVVLWLNQGLAYLGIKNTVAISLAESPVWLQFLTMFLIVDFTHWNVHRMLHRVPWLWRFHKVHHSVKQMGFAAHLRFHFMETIVYKSITYLPLALIGFGLDDFFLVYIISLIIGHLNHANLGWGYGWLGYVFNNPKMHIWHHAKALPKGRYGVNFGLSLSIWDYLFNTAYIPNSGKNIALGFEEVEAFPKGFLKQTIYPFRRNEK
ncbi:MAG: sterol desaturase family protein [Luteibaculum sp.]